MGINQILYKRTVNIVCLLFWRSENKWFLSSSLWPCEAADLESRIHVLMRLAEKTSHRDTLEALCNLPGLKEPNGEEQEGILYFVQG